VFEFMHMDLNKLGKDTKQSLSLYHVQWFMYEVIMLPSWGLGSQHHALSREATSQVMCIVCSTPCNHQLLKSLRYIHSGGIMHRDIKPANILVSEACTCAQHVCSARVPAVDDASRGPGVCCHAPQ
jgi:serine/threonine protein kinase